MDPSFREQIFQHCIWAFGTSGTLYCITVVLNAKTKRKHDSLIPLSWHGLVSQVFSAFMNAFFKVDTVPALVFTLTIGFLCFYNIQFQNLLCISHSLKDLLRASVQEYPGPPNVSKYTGLCTSSSPLPIKPTLKLRFLPATSYYGLKGAYDIWAYPPPPHSRSRSQCIHGTSTSRRTSPTELCSQGHCKPLRVLGSVQTKPSGSCLEVKSVPEEPVVPFRPEWEVSTQ